MSDFHLEVGIKDIKGIKEANSIYNAYRQAIYDNGGSLYEDLYGDEIRNEDGEIVKKWVLKPVFEDDGSFK
jgi:hypothetical protein